MSEYAVTHDDLDAFDALMSNAHDGYLFGSRLHELHPVDPETGMPSIPEGYFWKVYKQYSSTYVGLFFREESVTERKGFFHIFTKKTVVSQKVTIRKIEDHHIDKKVSDPVAAITGAATSLLSALPGHLEKEVNPVDFAAYYGEYPPKNLLTIEES